MIVLIAVIAVNVIISLWGFQALRGNPMELDAASGRPAADRFLFIPHAVARGENGLGWLLAHFAHSGWFHLGFNMLALFSFAGGVIQDIGPVGFLVIYVLSGMGSDLVVFALRRDDPTYRCLGASGSVFGIVLAAVVIDPGISVIFLFIPVPIPGPVFSLAYIVIAVILIARNTRDGISHEGHLGGALTGLVVTGVMAPAGLSPLLLWFTNLLG